MKKSFFLIFYLFCIFCSASCNNKIDFSLITDTNIPHEEENLISELKNNVLVAKEKGKEVSRYYSSNGNILTIESINNNIVRVRRKKPRSANRKKPNFDKRKEPKLPESDLLFRVIQAVPLLERPLFF